MLRRDVGGWRRANGVGSRKDDGPSRKPLDTKRGKELAETGLYFGTFQSLSGDETSPDSSSLYFL